MNNVNNVFKSRNFLLTLIFLSILLYCLFPTSYCEDNFIRDSDHKFSFGLDKNYSKYLGCGLFLSSIFFPIFFIPFFISSSFTPDDALKEVPAVLSEDHYLLWRRALVRVVKDFEKSLQDIDLEIFRPTYEGRLSGIIDRLIYCINTCDNKGLPFVAKHVYELRSTFDPLVESHLILAEQLRVGSTFEFYLTYSKKLKKENHCLLNSIDDFLQTFQCPSSYTEGANLCGQVEAEFLRTLDAVKPDLSNSVLNPPAITCGDTFFVLVGFNMALMLLSALKDPVFIVYIKIILSSCWWK